MRLRSMPLAAFAALTLLSACATVPKSISVTYVSVPSRADIFVGQHFVGETPVTVQYTGKVPKHVLPGAHQCFVPATSLTALWPSGAAKHVRSILACTDGDAHQSFTFQRPAGAPWANIDEAYAAHDSAAVAAATHQDALEQAQQDQLSTARRAHAAHVAGEIVEGVLAIGLGVVAGEALSADDTPPYAGAVATHDAERASRPVVTSAKKVVPAIHAPVLCTGNAVGQTAVNVVLSCH